METKYDPLIQSFSVAIISLLVANLFTWLTDWRKQKADLKNKRVTYVDRFTLIANRLSQSFGNLIADIKLIEFFGTQNVDNASKEITLLDSMNQEVVVLPEVDLRRKIITVVGSASILLNDIRGLEKQYQEKIEKYSKNSADLENKWYFTEVDFLKIGIAFDKDGRLKNLEEIDFKKKAEEARRLTVRVKESLDNAKKKLIDTPEEKENNTELVKAKENYHKLEEEYRLLQLEILKTGMAIDEKGDILHLEIDSSDDRLIGAGHLVKQIKGLRENEEKSLATEKESIMKQRLLLVSRIVGVQAELRQVINTMENI